METREPRGGFVDVKINAPDLLRVEIKKKKRGRVWVSGVCDPYQPLEAKYRLTRRPASGYPLFGTVLSDCQIDIQVKSDNGDKHTGPDKFIPCIDLYPVIRFDRYK